jgi:hypothetical protein
VTQEELDRTEALLDQLVHDHTKLEGHQMRHVPHTRLWEVTLIYNNGITMSLRSTSVAEAALVLSLEIR